MKKGKLNNSGFVLVETLVVTVFVLAIFAVLYNNFSPIIGEYEKREFYDDIDGKYAAYWIKRIIENPAVNFNSGVLTSGCAAGREGHLKFECSSISDSSIRDVCTNLRDRMNVSNVYITTYNLVDFKNKLSGGCASVSLSGFSGGMHRYVGYLPEYKVDSLNGAKYRIIVEFTRNDGDGDTYMAYSTFEVIK